MKKLLTLFLGLVAVTVSNAQDFKQSGTEKNLEVQFAPLGGSPIGMGGIRFRKFTSPTSALRATVFLGLANTSTVTQDENKDLGDKELKDRKSTFDFSIRPGVEKHFAGTDRLSPYVGAELEIGLRTVSERSEFQDQNDAVKETKTTGDGGFMRFGLNGIAGCDYYIAKHLYLGMELGVGLGINRASTIKVKPAEGSETETKEGNENTFNFGPIVTPTIRLGFLF